ncbi:hypothetical protein BDV24DRAFT_57000 [Aspergillus arachidicola]|uniref:Uncharacterized protein n=1 Tax=Aspergillus arachidicola TaxID=656916 RepID=A0A5N6Y726_9EURO|nr:hypothetical protein BDV24DRAFT_57000 [Aspergillus arachidicola]
MNHWLGSRARRCGSGSVTGLSGADSSSPHCFFFFFSQSLVRAHSLNPEGDGRLIRLENALIGKCHLNLKAAIFIVSFDGESTTTNSSKVQSSCFLFLDGRDSDLTEELPSFPPSLHLSNPPFRDNL